MANQPIDPANSPPIAIVGRVVTMNGRREVFDDHVVYARNGSIEAIAPEGEAPPDGFEQAPVVRTRGTIYPGLVELHNHLSYDALTLWQVPATYANRDQWGSPNPEYRRLISGPMQAIGQHLELIEAVVRYVEVKCLLGGTTTSQGIRLASAPGIVRHYRGLVRNVEATGDPQLPNARARIPDIAASDADRFLETISGATKMILHLSEGTNDAARRHFEALEIKPDRWAITPNLIGIHCVALTAVDFKIVADHGASMVWSPFSNLLLYGKTADVQAAHEHQVPIALGSDWSPSGSKNLLGELKVARLASDLFSDEDLVAMATCVPARMLGWQEHLGTLQPGARADLVVLAGHSRNSYRQLLDATEADLRLVTINGVPRLGTETLMRAAAAPEPTETITIAGSKRVLYLEQLTADPDVASISLAEATRRLRDALRHLPSIGARRGAVAEAGVRLAIAGLVDTQTSNRPHLPLRGQLTGPELHPMFGVAAEALGPLELDALTAVDAPEFYRTIAGEQNLPVEVRRGLVVHAPRP